MVPSPASDQEPETLARKNVPVSRNRGTPGHKAALSGYMAAIGKKQETLPPQPAAAPENIMAKGEEKPPAAKSESKEDPTNEEEKAVAAVSTTEEKEARPPSRPSIRAVPGHKAALSGYMAAIEAKKAKEEAERDAATASLVETPELPPPGKAPKAPVVETPKKTASKITAKATGYMSVINAKKSNVASFTTGAEAPKSPAKKSLATSSTKPDSKQPQEPSESSSSSSNNKKAKAPVPGHKAALSGYMAAIQKKKDAMDITKPAEPPKPESAEKKIAKDAAAKEEGKEKKPPLPGHKAALTGYMAAIAAKGVKPDDKFTNTPAPSTSSSKETPAKAETDKSENKEQESKSTISVSAPVPGHKAALSGYLAAVGDKKKPNASVLTKGDDEAPKSATPSKDTPATTTTDGQEKTQKPLLATTAKKAPAVPGHKSLLQGYMAAAKKKEPSSTTPEKIPASRPLSPAKISAKARAFTANNSSSVPEDEKPVTVAADKVKSPGHKSLLSGYMAAAKKDPVASSAPAKLDLKPVGKIKSTVFHAKSEEQAARVPETNKMEETKGTVLPGAEPAVNQNSAEASAPPKGPPQEPVGSSSSPAPVSAPSDVALNTEDVSPREHTEKPIVASNSVEEGQEQAVETTDKASMREAVTVEASIEAGLLDEEKDTVETTAKETDKDAIQVNPEARKDEIDDIPVSDGGSTAGANETPKLTESSERPTTNVSVGDEGDEPVAGEQAEVPKDRTQNAVPEPKQVEEAGVCSSTVDAPQAPFEKACADDCTSGLGTTSEESEPATTPTPDCVVDSTTAEDEDASSKQDIQNSIGNVVEDNSAPERTEGAENDATSAAQIWDELEENQPGANKPVSNPAEMQNSEPIADGPESSDDQLPRQERPVEPKDDIMELEAPESNALANSDDQLAGEEQPYVPEGNKMKAGATESDVPASSDDHLAKEEPPEDENLESDAPESNAPASLDDQLAGEEQACEPKNENLEAGTLESSAPNNSESAKNSDQLTKEASSGVDSENTLKEAKDSDAPKKKGFLGSLFGRSKKSDRKQPKEEKAAEQQDPVELSSSIPQTSSGGQEELSQRLDKEHSSHASDIDRNDDREVASPAELLDEPMETQEDSEVASPAELLSELMEDQEDYQNASPSDKPGDLVEEQEDSEGVSPAELLGELMDDQEDAAAEESEKSPSANEKHDDTNQPEKKKKPGFFGRMWSRGSSADALEEKDESILEEKEECEPSVEDHRLDQPDMPVKGAVGECQEEALDKQESESRDDKKRPNENDDEDQSEVQPGEVETPSEEVPSSSGSGSQDHEKVPEEKQKKAGFFGRLLRRDNSNDSDQIVEVEASGTSKAASSEKAEVTDLNTDERIGDVDSVDSIAPEEEPSLPGEPASSEAQANLEEAAADQEVLQGPGNGDTDASAKQPEEEERKSVVVSQENGMSEPSEIASGTIPVASTGANFEKELSSDSHSVAKNYERDVSANPAKDVSDSSTQVKKKPGMLGRLIGGRRSSKKKAAASDDADASEEASENKANPDALGVLVEETEESHVPQDGCETLQGQSSEEAINAEHVGEASECVEKVSIQSEQKEKKPGMLGRIMGGGKSSKKKCNIEESDSVGKESGIANPNDLGIFVEDTDKASPVTTEPSVDNDRETPSKQSEVEQTSVNEAENLDMSSVAPNGEEEGSAGQQQEKKKPGMLGRLMRGGKSSKKKKKPTDGDAASEISDEDLSMSMSRSVDESRHSTVDMEATKDDVLDNSTSPSLNSVDTGSIHSEKKRKKKSGMFGRIARGRKPSKKTAEAEAASERSDEDLSVSMSKSDDGYQERPSDFSDLAEATPKNVLGLQSADDKLTESRENAGMSATEEGGEKESMSEVESAANDSEIQQGKKSKSGFFGKFRGRKKSASKDHDMSQGAESPAVEENKDQVSETENQDKEVEVGKPQQRSSATTSSQIGSTDEAADSQSAANAGKHETQIKPAKLDDSAVADVPVTNKAEASEVELEDAEEMESEMVGEHEREEETDDCGKTDNAETSCEPVSDEAVQDGKEKAGVGAANEDVSVETDKSNDSGVSTGAVTEPEQAVAELKVVNTDELDAPGYAAVTKMEKDKDSTIEPNDALAEPDEGDESGTPEASDSVAIAQNEDDKMQLPVDTAAVPEHPGQAEASDDSPIVATEPAAEVQSKQPQPDASEASVDSASVATEPDVAAKIEPDQADESEASDDSASVGTEPGAEDKADEQPQPDASEASDDSASVSTEPDEAVEIEQTPKDISELSDDSASIATVPGAEVKAEQPQTDGSEASDDSASVATEPDEAAKIEQADESEASYDSASAATEPDAEAKIGQSPAEESEASDDSASIATEGGEVGEEESEASDDSASVATEPDEVAKAEQIPAEEAEAFDDSASVATEPDAEAKDELAKAEGSEASDDSASVATEPDEVTKIEPDQADDSEASDDSASVGTEPDAEVQSKQPQPDASEASDDSASVATEPDGAAETEPDQTDESEASDDSASVGTEPDAEDKADEQPQPDASEASDDSASVEAAKIELDQADGSEVSDDSASVATEPDAEAKNELAKAEGSEASDDSASVATEPDEVTKIEPDQADESEASDDSASVATEPDVVAKTEQPQTDASEASVDSASVATELEAAARIEPDQADESEASDDSASVATADARIKPAQAEETDASEDSVSVATEPSEDEEKKPKKKVKKKKKKTGDDKTKTTEKKKKKKIKKKDEEKKRNKKKKREQNC